MVARLPAWGLLGAAAVLLALTIWRAWPRVAAAGFACVFAALLVTPAIWSGLSTLNSSANQSLPAAYTGRQSNPPNGGGLQINQTLLSFLQANTKDTKYLMAVPSAMQGADYVLATGRPVLYLGGFMGQDKVVTTADLARMVANGELRYIYWDGNGRNGFGGQTAQSDITAWVLAHGKPVRGYETQTQNAGAPDGTATGGVAGRGGLAGGNMQVTLYDLRPAA